MSAVAPPQRTSTPGADPTTATLEQIRARAGRRFPAPPQLSRKVWSPGQGAPLSYAQERVWFLEQLGALGTAYSSPVAWRLVGRLDLAVLEATLRELVRRHEGLRTHFGQTEDGPVQLVGEPGEFRITLLDLSSLDRSDREAALEVQLAVLAEQPFDLGQGPLFRADTIKMGAEDHVLLLNMHHIVSDGWSLGVLTAEISAVYGAFAVGLSSPLGNHELQYRDFAIWQRDWLKGEELERQLDYWRGQLQDAPAALELPTDRPRPAEASFKAETLPVALTRTLTEALNTVARRNGATLYMVLLAALHVVLGRWSGQKDLVLGTPIAGRTQAQTDGVIGFFVNTLPMRAQPAGRKPFAQLLSEVKDAAIASYGHQDFPFEKLVAELSPQRDMSRQPIVQVLFALQNILQDALALPNVSVTRKAIHRAYTKFELTLLLEEIDGRVSGVLEFAASLFDLDTIERLWGHFVEVLHQVAIDDRGAIDDLELAGPLEREALLHHSAGIEQSYPQDALIFDGFEARALTTPHGVAIRCGPETITYSQLSRLSTELALQLRRGGDVRGQPVALAMDRTPALIAAMLAIVKAGGHYVPIDPRWPTERVAAILTQLNIRLGLVDPAPGRELPLQFSGLEAVLAVWNSERCEWVTLSSTPSPTSAYNERPPHLDRSQTSSSLAYIIFTSGSTGTPKGIAVAHKAAVNLFDWTNRKLGVTQSDTLLWVTPPTFDLSVYDVFGTLAAGATIRLPAGDEGGEPAQLAELIASGAVSVWDSAPPMLNEVAQFLPSTPQRGSGLRGLITGGDWIPLSLPDLIHAAFPDCLFLASGGATEATVYSNYYLVEEVDPCWKSIPYGRPIQNTQYYVLNDGAKLCPVGIEGDLYIAGAALAIGYFGQPGLTAASFVANPYGPPGSRMYHTGDRACWRRDGQIEFRGRRDRQVKVRGFRIELGEVLGALLKLQQVKDAVVRANTDPDGDKFLVAFVILEGQVAKADPPELRALLRASLPDYMIPTRILVVDSFPVTRNGKIDEPALSALASAKPEATEGPANLRPMAKELAALWSELLPQSPTAESDNFFELGAHSMTVARLCARVQRRWNVDLPIRAVFNNPRLGDLATEIAGRLDGRAPAGHGPSRHAGGLGPSGPIAVGTRVAASMAQERLWLVSSLDPAATSYSVPVAWRFKGLMDPALLAAALKEVVRRHESLRSRFEQDPEGLVQVIDDGSAFVLVRIDLSGSAPFDREQALRCRLDEMAGEPFQLAQGPLFRAALIALGEQDHALFINVHHIVADDWSLNVLTEELTALYAAYSSGRNSPLPEPELQFRDFARWQRDRLEGGELSRQLDYWRSRLLGAPAALEMPTAGPRATTPVLSAGQQAVHLPPRLTEALKVIARRSGCTVYMVLLAAYHLALARWSGQNDVIVGIAASGRPFASFERAVGFFINILPVRLRTEKGMSFEALLDVVRETVLKAQEHQDVPFERLVEALQPARELSRHPVFQAAFDYVSAPAASPALENVEVRAVDVASKAAKFDLSLSLRAHSDGIEGRLEFAAELFSARMMASFVGSYVSLLESLAEDPGCKIDDLNITSAQAVDELIRLGEPSFEQVGEGLFAHERFEEHARKCPSKTAIVIGEDSLSYGELNRWAEQLADDLIARGAGPGDLVGIYVDRSPLMVAAVLATLKAGAAYLPLDTTIPSFRTDQIIEQAEPGLLVTTPDLELRLVCPAERLLVVAGQNDGSHGSVAFPRAAVTPSSPAYVIFTSGSTGAPKGVVLTHGGLRCLADAQRAVLGVGDGDRILQFARLAFDAATFEIFAALASGAALVLGDRYSLLPGVALAELMIESEVTAAVLPPSALPLLHAYPIPRLRLLLAAGEALPSQEVGLWATDVRRFINAYGPSEATIWSTYCDLGERQRTRVPIGRPVPGVRAYILDERLALAPRGSRGELCLGGDLVGQGYLGQSGLTADRFVANPFGSPGERLYRTGDLVRWNDEGELEFHGRLDRQTKVRGFRIELDEVETALAAWPEVSQAHSTVWNDQVVAYVVPGPAGHFDETAARERLASALPDYMVPTRIIVLGELPTDLNGKVDVRGLPAPVSSSESLARPESELEATITAIWQDVLKVPEAGRDQNFFDLGGTSLSLMKAFARLQTIPAVRSKHPKLKPVDLFRHTTVARLAAHLQGSHLNAGCVRRSPPSLARRRNVPRPTPQD